MINPFGKYIQMTKKMIELLINGYEYYENERKNKDEIFARNMKKQKSSVETNLYYFCRR